MAQHDVAHREDHKAPLFVPPTPVRRAEPVDTPTSPLSILPPTRAIPVNAEQAQAGAAAAGLGELAKPASADSKPAQATPPAEQSNPDDAQQRQIVTGQMEALKEAKHVIRPGDQSPDAVLLQQQLKQLGLHIKETGVMDKDTQAVVKAIQTGGGLGPDGIVGPKTIDLLLTLDKSPSKPDTAAAGDDKGGDNTDHIPDDPKLAAVYLFNRMRAANASDSLTPQQEKDMEQFVKNWESNKARYQEVADSTGVPAKLIASLHWRESTGDFGTYLHQGDPLGKKAVNEPADIPIFKEWEPAAEHALGMKKGIRDSFKIDQDTTDEAALTSYAERYNGLGYFNYRAMASPYVYAGSDQYKKGKYVGDGNWDANHKDTQLGVLPMMRRIDRFEREQAEKAAKEQADKQKADPNQHFAQ